MGETGEEKSGPSLLELLGCGRLITCTSWQFLPQPRSYKIRLRYKAGDVLANDKSINILRLKRNKIEDYFISESSEQCHLLLGLGAWQLNGDECSHKPNEGDEGSHLPNCQTTLVIALDALFLLFCIFINTTAYHLGRYEPSPPSTKELHARW